jgi:hypothetical protein
VQNRVALAMPILPNVVQREGISVKKNSPTTMIFRPLGAMFFVGAGVLALLLNLIFRYVYMAKSGRTTL